MDPLRYLQFVFFVSACASLQTALGRVADAANFDIIGGNYTNIEDANYMAGLFNSCGFLCVGSIVHESYILTSADCANRVLLPNYHCGSSKAEVNGVYHNIINHKTCRRRSICLLKLNNPLKFSKFVGKVQLPLQNDPVRAGTIVEITGWGTNDADHHHFPETLLRAKIVVKPYTECPRLNGLICAGPPPHATGDFSDDEGAPVTIGTVQVGIGSIKLKSVLGHRYYIGISKFTEWIYTTIKNNS